MDETTTGTQADNGWPTWLTEEQRESLKQTAARCDKWLSDEMSPDGLIGTPAERFDQVLRHVLAVPKEEINRREAEWREQPSPRRGHRKKAA